MATADVVGAVLRLDPRVDLGGKFVENMLSPLVQLKDTRAQVNLLPAEMTRLWDNAVKDKDTYHWLGYEQRPLWAWCKVGFDNTFNDTGISLREMACRTGSFVHQRVEEYKASHANIESPHDPVQYDFAISNTGFIEPWMYLTIAMSQESDGRGEMLVHRYNHLRPCMEAMFENYKDRVDTLRGAKVKLSESMCNDGRYFLSIEYQNHNFDIDQSILRKQAEWLQQHAIGDKILEQKIAGKLK
jgi:hypothetical protein